MAKIKFNYRAFAELLRGPNKKMQIAELAALLGYSRNHLSRWVNGRQAPPVKMIPHIARILGVEVDDLMTDADTSPALTGQATDKKSPADGLTAGERSLLELYRSLDARGQKAVMSYAFDLTVDPDRAANHDNNAVDQLDTELREYEQQHDTSQPGTHRRHA